MTATRATQRTLGKSLANKLDYLSPKDADTAVKLIFSYLAEELSNNNRVEIRGFGSLSIRQRKFAHAEGMHNAVYYRMSPKLLKIYNNSEQEEQQENKEKDLV